MKRYTIDDVLTRLRRRVLRAGTQAAAARQLGVTRGYLSDILARRRDPGPRVLAALRLRHVPPPPQSEHRYVRAVKAR